MQESFPAENWTAESLTKTFTGAGFSTDTDGMYKHFEEYGNAENVSSNVYFVVDEYLANQVVYLNQRDNVTTWTPETVLRAIDDAGLNSIMPTQIDTTCPLITADIALDNVGMVEW